MFSLKNKNIKRYVILSAITVLIIGAIIFGLIVYNFNVNKNNIINKYNIDEMNVSFAIEEIEQNMYISLIILAGILIFITIIIIIYFWIALCNEEKEIRKIRTYLDDFSSNKFKLDLEEMAESEMSHIINDIYKIVSDLKKKSDSLAKDRETLSNYLADISHQIRTPLMAITAMVDAIIQNENKLDANTKKFVYEISRQLNQINWLVDSLLKMAKLDTKTVEFFKENTNLFELIQTVKNNMSIFLEIKNINLNINVDNKINIQIDEKWLIEAIENILKNCIEHSNANSEINITCTENPLYINLVIRDNGSGINEEDLPKIFDKFYKGKDSSSNNFGIGLSLAKSIIESQNGEILVESKLGEGTTFIIKIYQK